MVLLGKHGLLTDIKRNLKYTDWCGSLPFKWNQTENILEMKSQNKRKLYGIRLGIAFLYLTMALIQVIRAFKNSSLMVVTHSIMFLSCAMYTLSSHLVCYNNLPDVVQLCNAFIKYEERFTMEDKHANVSTRKLSTTDLLLKCMVYLLTCTGICMPIVYHLDVLRNPCLPLYVGNWVSAQCQDDKPGYPLEATWGFVEVVTKLGISLLSYLQWSLLLVGCNWETSLAYIMEGQCFRIYLADFGKKLLRVKKNEHGEIRALTLFRRQLQIMSIHYRQSHSQFQIGFAIPCWIAMETICLYNSISLISGKDTGGSIWYNLLYAWCGSVCFCVILFVFGILADVHTTSNEVRENITRNLDLKRNKWFSRWIKSCPTLKIYFGGSNYLEKLTPLNFQDFVINQTVSLLLLKN